MKKRQNSVAVKAILLVLLAFGAGYSYSGIEHAWIGINSWWHTNLWQDLDNTFHQDLTRATEPNSIAEHDQAMLRKFYLIGCMLPDLFTSEGQGLSRGIVQTLYNLRNEIPLNCPMDIREATKVLCDAPVVWLDAEPNNNLPKLHAMVVYAQNHDWTSWQKALIYGAYAHVVMDLQGGYFQQPTMWGKDFVLEPPEARLPEGIDILYNVEMHHNFFEPTHIATCQSQGWYNTMRWLYGESKHIDDHHIQLRAGACQFYRRYNSLGQFHKGWQDTLFEPERKFVEAVAGAQYNVQNLSPERLHAYLHGYSIVWFLIAGYPTRELSQAGGIYSHPEWNFPDILGYLLTIGLEGTSGWAMSELGQLALAAVKKTMLSLVSVGGLGYQAFLRIWHPDLDLFQPWPYYFEEASHLDDWYTALGPLGLQDEVQPHYAKLSSYINQWSNTARTINPNLDKPNLRSAYRVEPQMALNLMGEMRANINGGPSYLAHSMNYGFQSGAQTRLIGRKAGLVGGMFGDGDIQYRQPGVVNLCFKRGNNLLYSVVDVPRYGDPYYAQFYYDIVPFVYNAKMEVVGKADPSDPGQVFSTITVTGYGCRRFKGERQFSLSQIVNAGKTRVTFRLYNDDPLQLMLDGDYKAAFDGDVRISGNQLYRDWLKVGGISGT